jgi:hypothetical protein
VIRTEIFMAERVLLGDLVAFQLARKARSATQSVKLKYGAEHLAHDLRRQLDPEGAGNAISGQVAILVLAIDVDVPWVREHVGL